MKPRVWVDKDALIQVCSFQQRICWLRDDDMEGVMWTRTGSVKETPLPSLNSMCAWWGKTPVWSPGVNLVCCFSPSFFGWSLGIGFSYSNTKNYEIFPFYHWLKRFLFRTCEYSTERDVEMCVVLEGSLRWSRFHLEGSSPLSRQCLLKWTA